jgi:DNA repair exonuclease SbcCD ATPase subunit
MIRIVSVEGENFRSYRELSFRVPETGLVQIDGDNRDTGGSNMAGKSTALDLIYWILYGEIPRGGLADSVIQIGSDSCHGRMSLHVGAQLWTIERRRPLRLTVTIDGVKQERKAQDLQALIEEKVMTRERFLIASYVSQDRSTSFFAMGDAERTRLMSVIANLEKLDRALDQAKAKKASLEAERGRLEGAAGALKGQVTDFARRLQELLDAESPLAQALADATTAVEQKQVARPALEQQIQALLAEVRTSIDAKYAEQLGIFQKKLPDLRVAVAAAEHEYKRATAPGARPQPEPELVKAVVDAEAEGKAIADRNYARERALAENKRLLESIQIMESNLKAAEAGTCRECRQLLPEADRAAVAAARRRDIEALRARIAEPPPAEDIEPARNRYRQAQETLSRRRAELEQEPNRLQKEMQHLRALVQGAEAEEKLLLNTKSQELKTATEQAKVVLVVFDSELAQLKATAEKAKATLEWNQKTRATLQKGMEAAERSLAENATALRANEQELALALDLMDLFGPKGYRALCFDNLVERIGEKAGEILLALTDGQYSTRLEQTREDGRGQTKIVLRPVILKGGQEIAPDFLSGGGLRRVALAYDVSVNLVASEDLPLFLDEGLGGLDEVGKYAALQLLQEQSLTRPVFVIDHTDSLKSAIDTRWTAVFEKGVSRLEIK